MAIILSMDMIYSIIEGIVPSRCRLTTRHLGATLFKLRLHQICKSHVTASMHHGTWGLMQSHFYWPYWRPDSSHHNEPALGGYQLLLSKIQGTQALIHYIERSTTQLVEYKALNLVDVGSSPMVKIISNMQVSCCCKHAPWHLGANAKSFFAHLIEDLTHHIVMSRPLGATNCSC